MRLLAQLEIEAGRPGEAATVLGRFATRGGPLDAETLDLQGRALMMSGQPRAAAEVLGRLAEATPRDAGILARLALARFSTGDFDGMRDAAQQALALEPNQPGARELLAMAALARGEAAAAATELEKLDVAAERASWR